MVTVTDSNAWFPYASVARIVIWCGPLLSAGTAMLYASSGESAILSEGKTACQSVFESTL